MSSSNPQPHTPEPDWAARAAALKEQLMKSKQVRAANVQVIGQVAQRPPDIVDKLMAELPTITEMQKAATSQNSAATAAVRRGLPAFPPPHAPQGPLSKGLLSKNVSMSLESERKPSKPTLPNKPTTPQIINSKLPSRDAKGCASGPEPFPENRRVLAMPTLRDPRKKPDYQRRTPARSTRDGSRFKSRNRRRPLPRIPVRERVTDAGSDKPLSDQFKDPDLRDWLQLTGWDDTNYRRQELVRLHRRRLDEISREPARQDEAERLSNRTREQNMCTSILTADKHGGRPNNRLADRRQESSDSGTLSRQRNSDLEAPDLGMLGNYPVTYAAVVKRGRHGSVSDRDPHSRFSQSVSPGEKRRCVHREESRHFGESTGERCAHKLLCPSPTIRFIKFQPFHLIMSRVVTLSSHISHRRISLEPTTSFSNLKKKTKD